AKRVRVITALSKWNLEGLHPKTTLSRGQWTKADSQVVLISGRPPTIEGGPCFIAREWAAVVKAFGCRPAATIRVRSKGRLPRALQEGPAGRGWTVAVYGDLTGRRLGRRCVRGRSRRERRSR